MILTILEGPKGVGKSTYLKHIQENETTIFPNRDTNKIIKYIHLDKNTPNTIEYFLELHNDKEVDYVLDRGWLSELVYSIIYGRNEKFTFEEVRDAGLLQIPLRILIAERRDIPVLFQRIAERDNIVLTDEYKRQVRQSNALFKLYSYVLKDANIIVEYLQVATTD